MPVIARFLILCITMMSCLQGCGYTLVGRGVFLPEHLRRINVPVFENRTTQYDLETIITYKVVERLNSYKGMEVVDLDKADGVLKGVITEYTLVPISYRSDGSVNEYRIQIRADIQLYDLVKKQVQFEQQGFIMNRDYQAAENIDDRAMMERQGWEEVAKDFAESLVSLILEGF